MLPEGLFPILDENHTKEMYVSEIIESFLDVDVNLFLVRNKMISKDDYKKYLREVNLMRQEMDFNIVVHQHLDLAMEIDAAGVHLTTQSITIQEARKKLGQKKIIGYSAHSLEEVADAKRQGADYCFLGAIFDTPKEHQGHPVIGLKTLELACQIEIPIYAIGGITEDNLIEVKKAGARGFSGFRAIYKNDDVEHNASKLNMIWGAF